MARGGRRAGTRGRGYAQRSDLRSALPLNAPTGLPYGDRQKLISAQRAVPMAPAPSPTTPPPPTGVAQGQAPPGPVPGGPGIHLMRPTERPGEPVTAGLPMGPGPGPEALGPLGQQAMANQGQSVGALLANLAAAPFATPQVQQLAAVASTGAK